MPLDTYRTLGRSGLVVSPLALGTMTFGTPRWGTADGDSAAIFDAYVAAGGNFLDSADVYAGGRSEELVGEFVASRKLRDKIVIATKFGFSTAAGNPNAGGNGRKNIGRAIDASLKRLKTDYVDLYWLHVWDTLTPADEVLQSLGDLVRAGKIRYFGLSDMPAWYAAKVATLAAARGVPGPVAMQVAYSLVERSVEREHLPAAAEFGLGVTPWGPLGAGFLAGKYRRDGAGAAGDGRLSGPNPYGTMMFTDRNWRILDVLLAVAAEVGRPPAEVALAWLAGRPGVTAPIVGATSIDQLRGHLAAIDLRLPAEATARLDEAGAPEAAFPYSIFTPEIIRGGIFGGVSVEK